MADIYFASASVAFAENKLLDKSKYEKLIASNDLQEALKYLQDFGIALTKDEKGIVNTEASLLNLLASSYNLVAEVSPNGLSSLVWRYTYDCANIKSLLKSRLRNVDATQMLFDFGTVSKENCLEIQKTFDFSEFPKTMGEKAKEAFDTAKQNANPQYIDFILDKSCFADLLAKANEENNEFIIDLIKTKIDLLNFLIATRVLKMTPSHLVKATLNDALLENGNISIESILQSAKKGEKEVYYLFCKDYSLAYTDSLSDYELQADNLFMKKLKNALFIPVGEERLTAYLLAMETEVKNLRIILTGKSVGLSSEEIQKRVRDSYV